MNHDEENDIYKIDARGMVFPVLAQEMSKGVAELISYHGLENLDDKETEQVLSHADDIRHEPYLIQVGPELWRRFLKVKPPSVSLADIMMALTLQEPDHLHKIVAAVVENPEEAGPLLSALIDDPKEFEVEEYDDGYSQEYEEENPEWR